MAGGCKRDKIGCYGDKRYASHDARELSESRNGRKRT